MEKIKFKSFKEASKIAELLKTYLPLGSATPEDVISFLEEQGLKHSGLIDNRRFAHTASSTPFENTISAVAPAKRVGWLFPAKWHIWFHFDKRKLAWIQVEEHATGF
jgi:hypothetical protein